MINDFHDPIGYYSIYGDKGCQKWLFVQNRPKIKKFRVILPSLILKIF
jgi:hypothetical protein